jgi:hypothetical protein
MKTNLVLDASNLVYRTFFANTEDSREMDMGMCYQMTLNSLSKYYNQYKADDVVIAFDMPKSTSWRKLYTKDLENCVTKKLYKGNRRQNLTEDQKKKLAELDNHLDELANIFKNQSGLIVLRKKYLEADDLIAGYTQKFSDDKHIVISADKDFIQLLDNGNVTLIDPYTDKPRDLSEWDHDAKYFMFEKCFRGDAGDNVQSSYPRLRSTKIKAAYADALARVNLMNHTFSVEEINGEGKLVTHNYTTGPLFEENELLMDLAKQPPYIRELIDSTITDAIKERGKYNYFDFVKFCGKYDLVAILNNVDKYTPLLSGKGRRFATE